VTLDTKLWLAGDGVTAVVVALIFWRRIFRTLPVFSSYLVWGLLTDAAQQAATHYYPASTYNIFIVGLIVDSLFQFAVLVELSWSVLRPIRGSLPRWSWIAVAVVFALASAVIWPFANGPGVSGFSLAGWLNVHVQVTFSVLRILLFLALAGCSQLLSISLRDRELQVATGLGFFSMVSLAVWIHHTGQPTGPQYHLLDQIVAGSYICSLGYWVFSFAQQETARREFTPQMQNFLLAVAGTARSTRMNLDAPPPGNDREDKK
jgi:hypothetical protein